MALSKQITPAATHTKFIRWAQKNGYHVGEMHGVTTVNPKVHTQKSWHNDKDPKTGMGLAADINYGANGPAERAKLIVAMHYARSLGLAAIYAWTGTAGVAKNHQNHLHVDVGEWSNIGDGLIRAKKVPLPKGVIVPGVNDSKPKPPAPKPPVNSGILRKGSQGSAVGRLQSGLNAHFPAYSNLDVDDKFGNATERTVKEFQRRVGIDPDGIVDTNTKKHLKAHGIIV